MQQAATNCTTGNHRLLQVNRSSCLKETLVMVFLDWLYLKTDLWINKEMGDTFSLGPVSLWVSEDHQLLTAYVVRVRRKTAGEVKPPDREWARDRYFRGIKIQGKGERTCLFLPVSAFLELCGWHQISKGHIFSKTSVWTQNRLYSFRYDLKGQTLLESGFYSR